MNLIKTFVILSFLFSSVASLASEFGRAEKERILKAIIGNGQVKKIQKGNNNAGKRKIKQILNQFFPGQAKKNKQNAQNDNNRRQRPNKGKRPQNGNNKNKRVVQQ